MVKLPPKTTVPPASKPTLKDTAFDTAKDAALKAMVKGWVGGVDAAISNYVTGDDLASFCERVAKAISEEISLAEK